VAFYLLDTNQTHVITEKLINVAEHRSARIKSSRHAAAVTRRGVIISTGWNKLKSHPMQAKFASVAGKPEAIFLHAETDAIIKTINKHGPEILTGCEMYIIRVTKNGRLAKSKPCISCLGLLNHFQINHVYHT